MSVTRDTLLILITATYRMISSETTDKVKVVTGKVALVTGGLYSEMMRKCLLKCGQRENSFREKPGHMILAANRKTEIFISGPFCFLVFSCLLIEGESDLF